jgi:hypothetical protein
MCSTTGILWGDTLSTKNPNKPDNWYDSGLSANQELWIIDEKEN